MPRGTDDAATSATARLRLAMVLARSGSLATASMMLEPPP
jgi:hypothetical protein